MSKDKSGKKDKKSKAVTEPCKSDEPKLLSHIYRFLIDRGLEKTAKQLLKEAPKQVGAKKDLIVEKVETSLDDIFYEWSTKEESSEESSSDSDSSDSESSVSSDSDSDSDSDSESEVEKKVKEKSVKESKESKKGSKESKKEYKESKNESKKTKVVEESSSESDSSSGASSQAEEKKESSETSSGNDSSTKRYSEEAEDSFRENPARKKQREYFSRIDRSKIAFESDTLQDNTYKGAAGTWGEKANDKLGKVRGKDFTKNKNKMKKGSYRGGSITMASGSYKFTD